LTPRKKMWMGHINDCEGRAICHPPQRPSGHAGRHPRRPVEHLPPTPRRLQARVRDTSPR
jgi:hypothetical protein